ncbi:hypothetical protein COCCADRAFT_33364 [Bipolaris zeicola 26-R-13]|uniref:Uncharacterized protein n=1 Tax=Cochliobolus carbonum (strain 26-R-13) TaxID=930089 RepID=W6YIR0_COCC2|nr:uncharacterized protein COCCADRAFT_33364 [Bipolaris zeicola 26-R-13]EUC37455.1 hypothetical protein COCCADRAFT_33364 [Bipolaris zeicola 26-R-13]
MVPRPRAQSDPLHTHEYRYHVQLMYLIQQVYERNQESSPLLHLPAELRVKIYNYVFDADSISPKYETQDHRTWEYPRSNLSLIQTCRQTWAETRLLPFTRSVFSGYSEHVIEMLCKNLTRSQANAISRVSLLVDAFAIYRDGKIPHSGLKPWIIVELSDLCTFEGLKELELVWFGSEIEPVQVALHEQVTEVLERSGRTDISLTVVPLPPPPLTPTD